MAVYRTFLGWLLRWKVPGVRTLRLAITVLLAITCLLATVARADDGVPIDFNRDVAPVLVRHCAACHNPSDPAGKLDLTAAATALAGGETGQPALVPGDVDASYAIERIKAGEMPPPGKGVAVPPADVAKLERWIAAGAVWPKDRVLSVFDFTTDVRAGRDWWSLKKPVRPALPTVQKADWVRNPIDAFVLARLEAAGTRTLRRGRPGDVHSPRQLRLARPAARPAEIERSWPTPSSDAYERLVDRLLASPRYGERWARHWLDVVRFGESNGYETNTARPNAWPYRDWVIEALNDDMPYPQFVLEQLAGDQVGVDAATGFLVGGAHDSVSSPDIELTLAQRLNDLDDMLSTTATAFLGLTVGCAKCHDHKFDPIAQRDYYALQAVFAGVQHGAARAGAPTDLPERKRQETQLREELFALERQIQDLTTRIYPLAHVGPSPTARRPPVNSRHNVDRFAPVEARSCGSRCWRPIPASRASTSWRFFRPTPARATWPWPAGRQGDRFERLLPTAPRNCTSSTTSTTAATATRGVGFRPSRAPAGCRSNWPSRRRSTASSGPAIARGHFAIDWRRATRSKSAWTATIGTRWRQRRSPAVRSQAAPLLRRFRPRVCRPKRSSRSTV